MWAAVRLFGRWSWDRTVWAIIIMLGMLCMATSCKSTRVEMRNGKPWTVETRELAGVVLSTEEIPPADVVTLPLRPIMQYGTSFLVAGVAAFCISLALQVWSSNPFIDWLAGLGTALGGGLAGTGILLMGIAWHLSAILVATALAAAVLFFRKARSLRRLKSELQSATVQEHKENDHG
jgi:hypothetical protein